jgi:hypothetical protein
MKIRIEETQTGNVYEYVSKKEPNKSNVGNCFYGELNYRGIAYLQNQGIPVESEDDWKMLLKKTFNLPDNALGRSPLWRTPTQRSKFQVYINDKEFFPDFSKNQKKHFKDSQPKRFSYRTTKFSSLESLKKEGYNGNHKRKS